MAEMSPTQGDAETWLGEIWRELLDAGVDAVVLLEDGREVYGPMSLHESGTERAPARERIGVAALDLRRRPAEPAGQERAHEGVGRDAAHLGHAEPLIDRDLRLRPWRAPSTTIAVSASSAAMFAMISPSVFWTSESANATKITTGRPDRA